MQEVLRRLKDFPIDSPCCSRVGIRTIFTLITSNQWERTAINVKTAFLQVNRSKEQSPYVPKGSKHVEHLEIAKMCLELS